MEGAGTAFRLQHNDICAHEVILHAEIVLQHAHFFHGFWRRRDRNVDHSARIDVPDAIDQIQGSG